MHQSAKHIAENATFQAFVNSYIREVHTGHLIDKEEWVNENHPTVFLGGAHILELELPLQAIRFAIEVNYWSLAGRHTFGTALKYGSKEKGWYKEDRFILMMALIHELHLMAKENGCHELASHFDELIVRLIGSYQTMTAYIENRMKDSAGLYSENGTFIETEQSLLFGHWLHPTPKSRQGMADWQHGSFAPELAGSFQLHYFQVDRQIVKEASVLKESAGDIILQSLLKFLPSLHIPEHMLVIPVHPLQGQWLLHQPYIRKAAEEGLIKDLGTMGSFYTATSSFRTVYHSDESWMYKFSIPVKLTNSLRVNRLHELKAGVVMAKLIRNISFLERHSSFQIMDDPAYITVDLPGQEESGFEVIIRTNLFPKGQDEGISAVAAIVQDPLPGQTSRLYHLIVKAARSGSQSLEQVSLEWFKKYWKCGVEPLIRLYDEHGIALEAHQQNSVLDVSTGYPETYYYRDNQGYYLSRSYENELRLTEPSLDETPELFYDDRLIQDRFTYYLFMNQVFSVIHRFGADGLVSEKTLLEWAIGQLELLENELTGQGKAFVHMILHQEKLAYKANLLTRFHDVDELAAELEQAIYTKLSNPFVLHRKEEKHASSISLAF
jgi:siderophore synthetase component